MESLITIFVQSDIYDYCHCEIMQFNIPIIVIICIVKENLYYMELLDSKRKKNYLMCSLWRLTGSIAYSINETMQGYTIRERGCVTISFNN